MLSMDVDKFSNWLIHRTGKCLVAGPCSVESEEQILGTAKELAPCDVTLLRGGIWKPRTRPGSFEGIGERGLNWLKAAGRATTGCHRGRNSGCAQTEARSIETCKWLLRSKTSPCGDSVTAERPA